jgi:hypothetical protein
VFTADAEWHALLGNAIGGLRASLAVLRTDIAQFEALEGWFRPVNIEIPHEDSITQALCGIFRKLKARQSQSDEFIPGVDLRQIHISLQDRRPLDPGIGPNMNPTDYMLLTSDTDLDLRIEAKIVAEDGDITEYLGTQGLRRFEDARNPYTLAPYGGMVAYVVDLDEHQWRQSIAARLQRRLGAERLRTVAIGGSPLVLSSHECTPERLNGGTTRLRTEVAHFVLEVDANPRRR